MVAARGERRAHAARIAADERHVRRLDRDVGAAPDRDPEVGRGERRCVVDPVADHRHDRPVRAGARRPPRPCPPAGPGPDASGGDPDLRRDGRRGGRRRRSRARPRCPRAEQLRDRLRAPRAGRVGDRQDAGAARRGDAGPPSARPRGDRAASSAVRDADAALGQQPADPTRPARPSTIACDAAAGDRAKPSRRGTRARRGWLGATIAAPSGCSLPRLDRAARSRTSRSATPRRGHDPATVGRPTREGAGLVEDDRIDLCRPSRAPPPLRNRIPASAPRPVPTMIAVGVASPIAHGQATITTLMKAVSASVSRGSGSRNLRSRGKKKKKKKRSSFPDEAQVLSAVERPDPPESS